MGFVQHLLQLLCLLLQCELLCGEQEASCAEVASPAACSSSGVRGVKTVAGSGVARCGREQRGEQGSKRGCSGQSLETCRDR